jgi:hypothetical protein
MNATAGKFRAGDIVLVQIPNCPVRPRAAVMRQSKVTGNLSLRLLADAGAYKEGSDINVAPYEVETVPASPYRQTTCKHCGLDIEGFAPFTPGMWRDRVNNRTCPNGPNAPQQHEPTEEQS